MEPEKMGEVREWRREEGGGRRDGGGRGEKGRKEGRERLNT